MACGRVAAAPVVVAEDDEMMEYAPQFVSTHDPYPLSPLLHAPDRLLEQLMVCLCLPVTHNGRKLKLLRQKSAGKE